MFRILFILFTLICGQASANIGIELDVVFGDSTVQCRYLYVLRHDVAESKNDTLAVFDSLSFNGLTRVSLFFTANNDGNHILLMVDKNGELFESNHFKISSQRTVFPVVVQQRQISVTDSIFLNPRKNDNDNLYLIFRLLFLAVKVLLAISYILVFKLRVRNIAIVSCAFLPSVLIEWFFPLNYFYRLLLIMLVEYLLIAIVGRRSISLLHAAALVVIVNAAGFGIISVIYLLQLFW
jgi:hypothetical protein